WDRREEPGLVQMILPAPEKEPLDVIVTYGPARMAFKFIDGTFPDYRRVLPEKTLPANAYNASYLADIATAIAKSTGNKNAPMAILESAEFEGPARIVTLDENIEYVLMPTRPEYIPNMAKRLKG